MKETSYPEGIDCVWLAVDKTGCVAAFVTAGVGPISLQALSSGNMLVEDIEECVSYLPKKSNVHLLVNVPRPDDFVAMAERGLFVFDWTDIHRSTSKAIRAYEMVAVPDAPIKVHSLPPELAEMAQRSVMNNLAFPDSQTLDVKLHFECCEGGKC